MLQNRPARIPFSKLSIAPGGWRAAAFLLLAALAVSCSKASDPSAAPATATKAVGGGAAGGGRGGRGGAGGAVPVTTATVADKSMPVTVHNVGNVEASSTVEVRSQVNGQLLTVSFSEGQDVTKDQLLFELDPAPFQLALQQSQAALARDQATAKGAAAILSRDNDLFGRGLLAKSDHDAATTQAAATQALAEADAAAVANAKLQLQYTKILAPISGRTGALLVHPGALVHTTDTTPLVIINQIAPVFVSFSVPSRLLPQLHAGQSGAGLPVKASPSGTAAGASVGKVAFINNAVDLATDTIRLKASFSNEDRRLWPGAFVDVTLQLSVNPHAIVIPNQAVQVGQAGQYAYVVKGDKTVEARPIVVAWTDGDDSVIQSGLKAGETVVTDGQLRLVPGATVTVKTGDAPAGGRP